VGPYNKSIQSTTDDISKLMKRIEATIGIKESDTGLAPPSQWDLVQDKQTMQEEQPLQVARCTKIIDANTDEAKYVINVRQIAKFVVGLGDRVAPTDIEEGMRVGVDRNKYQIQIPLPPKVQRHVPHAPRSRRVRGTADRAAIRRRAARGRASRDERLAVASDDDPCALRPCSRRPRRAVHARRSTRQLQ
jgi:hypothetical protein